MANEEMTAAKLMDWTVLRRDTFGNAYWYVEWFKGKPVAIWPITASVMHDYDKYAPRGGVRATTSPPVTTTCPPGGTTRTKW